MATFKGKPRGSSNWIPNQVLYGMDCSDPEPANWRPFGQLQDEKSARDEAQKHAKDARPVLPVQ